MRDSYSLYEAKSKFSALVRMVREGHRVVITVHGQPAIEMRAVEPEPGNLASKLARLEERGVLVARVDRTALRPVGRRKGALSRFLADRD
jgi:antitoxin (DNA-binding transcriptional repressor) of toxin-antitoxin stability system